jgi:hypothetical protein
MQKVKMIIDEEEVIIENVYKVEIDMCFDMFENKIIIHTKDGKKKFKQYQINHMTIEG